MSIQSETTTRQYKRGEHTVKYNTTREEEVRRNSSKMNTFYTNNRGGKPCTYSGIYSKLGLRERVYMESVDWIGRRNTGDKKIYY
jgi:hypothetical protein